MKKKVLKISALFLMLGLSCGQAFSFTSGTDGDAPIVVRLNMLRSATMSKQASATTPVMGIEGTGKSEKLTVVASGLEQDVTLTVTTGFAVSPSVIKAGTETTEVTVTNISNLARTEGQLILRSGDVRSYVKLVANGTPLSTKDLSRNPVYTGGADEEKAFEGFAPGEDGYTFEVRAKVDDASQLLKPYAVTADGGFMSYISSSALGLYNSTSMKEGVSNPSNGGTFYNTDGLYHTYRYAVTPDNHIFVYRDGIAIDTLRTSDYGLQPEWAVENGDIEENLIKNPGFEGEWNFNRKRNITDRIEGWDVYPYDQYNSTQSIKTEERSNEVDQNNHVLSVDRYMWSDGWAAAEISQIVDVAPNEVYSFSALAKGGIKKDGTQLGSLRIQDMQNADNKLTIPVTSESYQKYAADFTTTATTKQIRVYCYLERDKWGASITELKVDDVKLTGVRRLTADKIGFKNENADIAYFNFDNTGAYAPLMASLTTSVDTLTVEGTNSTATFVVNNANLANDIQVSATTGFAVTPSVIKVGEQNVEVTVKNMTSLAHNSGKVILRSGDMRAYVNVGGIGTPLETKDLSQNPVYAGGTDEEMTFDGFAPGENGYTIEIRAKVDDATKSVHPLAVSDNGVGFKGYISSTSTGLFNSTSKKDGISNPSNGGTFYNTDGLYHTYRYAVTPDNHIFVYRDGIAIDTLRTSDYGLQPEWAVENGDIEENLIKNPGFEGEWNFNRKRNITDRIEGWDVYPYDQYNSTQSIKTEERSNEVDQNNHVLSVDRYMWSDGWAAAEISQIVDVAPNEVYSFSALAKGGIKKDGTQLGSLRIQDMQNADNKLTIPVTSETYQKYAADFTTTATTKQIRVYCYLERDKWGASITELKVDDVKLTGVKRNVAKTVGFQNEQADIAYFSFDNTGAYAPLMASLTTSVDTLTVEGTNSTAAFTVNNANLANDIQVSATTGFFVTPSVIKAGEQNVEVIVKNMTSLAHNSGKVILRSGDMRAYVNVGGIGTPLETKDLSQNPVYAGGADEEMTFDGFAPGENGYTFEVRAKVDDDSKLLSAFAQTSKGASFQSYVSSSALGLYNSTSKKDGISNPSNGGTFYNTDGLYHTYRYAVTPDNHIFVYRDGIAIDTLRTSDYGLQPEWAVENGDIEENLIKNPGFEGEWNFNRKRNITDRIEGWDVYPYDQYNSTQSVKTEERSNEVDQNNHVLSVDRYMWSDGWAAAEISQIVDVAPNEVYSFSALAKGGIKKDGTQLGSLRIQDMQNADNKLTIPVTSETYQKYAADFTTTATTKQIRVYCYLERDKWGASITELKVDDVKLTGVRRLTADKIGFKNENADIAYFNFDNTGAYAPQMASLTTSVDTLTISGTGENEIFVVSAAQLTGDIQVSATAGFAVSPVKIPAGTKSAKVKVTNLTTLAHNSGKVILRSGDVRAYVNVGAVGTELEQKDLSQNPVYAGGTDEDMAFDGFAPSDNGYTLEFRAKVDDLSKEFLPYAVTDKGVGFKGYVTATNLGLYNGTSRKEGISNPANGGTFYNTDGLYHTYRFAVTSDNRMFIYRDGLAIDTLRTADFALQPEWTVENGRASKNLLKNPGFEGEWDFNAKRNITDRIEGWDVYPFDQYNSTQQIVAEERSNEVDQNNHVLSVDRYMWSDGWAAAEISQVVDVAPNEVYSFSALAKGGIKKDGTQLGSLRIQDMQNADNKVTIPVTSESYQKYSCDFETKATTKQVRVYCYLERDKWGASISALKVDDVKLTGYSRVVKPQVGFQNVSSDIAYFNFDCTGAYAPAFPSLTAEDISTAVDAVDADCKGGVRAKVQDGMLTLANVEDHSRVAVYTVGGAPVGVFNDYVGDTGIALPGRGTYIVLVIEKNKRQGIKVVY